MRVTKNHFLSAFILVTVVVVASLTNPGPTIAQGNRPSTPVELVSPTPLPVSGAVTLSGTPSVNVANTPGVTIAGNTANTPLYVRDLNNPPHQPVVINFNETMGNAAPQTQCPTLYTVPAGKQLVIEYVNLSGIGPSSPTETLLFEIPSFPAYVFDVEQHGDTQTGLSYSHNEMTRIYFGPGDTVVACAARGLVTTGSMVARAKLSGYLADVP